MLARMRVPVPGTRSRALFRRLQAVESRNVTAPGEAGAPIFWEAAAGANVRDVDGNVYVDLTGGFAVAAAGHANPRVARAIADQACRLPHGLGDVYPTEPKVRLLETLARLAPGRLGVGILASAGAEAVEVALKTALLGTGRAGVLSFHGSYHGLTYGALAATGRAEFRKPFAEQLFAGVRFAPYPDASRSGEAARAQSLQAVAEALREAEVTGTPVGAVLVEPIQGRGGLVVPPPGFLRGLKVLCEGHGALLVCDEIYTGLGRTGRWFAVEEEGVEPDLLLVGKALAGSLPLSAAIGTPEIMDAWPSSRGEALHTSTFLGNPVSCAAALAHLAEIEERGLLARARDLGERVLERLSSWPTRFPHVRDVRGRGLLIGIELVEPGDGGAPAGAAAGRIIADALRGGVLLLAEGPGANVLAVTPPLTISERQLDFSLDVLEELLGRESAR